MARTPPSTQVKTSLKLSMLFALGAMTSGASVPLEFEDRHGADYRGSSSNKVSFEAPEFKINGSYWAKSPIGVEMQGARTMASVGMVHVKLTSFEL